MNPNTERDDREPIWCVNCGNQIYQSDDKWFHLSTARMSCDGVSPQATPPTTSIAERAATRMRDRCVEKVREMGDEWRRQANSREELQFANDRVKRSAQANAADWIITALQSLTLEGEQEK